MGIDLYGEGRFIEAITVLRLIPPGDPLQGEAIYWVALAGVSSGDYEQALRDLDLLERRGSRFHAEIPYHRGRCLFYLGRYEEAIANFNKHIENPNVSNADRAASYYWTGEALFAMGRLDSAADAFSTVVEKYPYSVKYDAASYRLDALTQKKVEEELLTILRWSHEESLRSLEEYQERERIYNQAIAAYEKRIDGLLAGTDTELYETGAEMRIAALEASLAEANAALDKMRGGGNGAKGAVAATSAPPPLSDEEKARRIMELRSAVTDLSARLTNTLSGENP
jgi:tetratricopeptide (TPR) repeat protein